MDWDSLERAVRSQQRNREKYTPVISLYRWWARRPHALIGSLVEAASHGLKNPSFTVSDPFSGGGTAAVEVVRKGFCLYAQDLHPWATYGLRAILDKVDAHELRGAVSDLLSRLEALRDKVYTSSCRIHGPSETVHAFWVRWNECRDCGRRLYFFPYSLITLLSRAQSEDRAYFGCSKCGAATIHKVGSTRRRCGNCGYLLARPDLPLIKSRRLLCPHCGWSNPLFGPFPRWKLCLVQRLCKVKSRTIQHFDLPTRKDVPEQRRLRLAPPLGDNIPDGVEMRVLRRFGFRRWRDLYPDRQLHCLILAARAATRLRTSVAIQRRLLLAIASASEMAGYVCRWDRYHPKVFEAVANHRFSPIGLAVEVNPLSSRGRGTIPRRLEASIKGAEWASRNFRGNVLPAKLLRASHPRLRKMPPKALIVTGSSERQLPPATSVDAVITDPPYFDSIQYAELANLYQVWSRAIGYSAGSARVAISHEAVPNGVRGTGTKEYGRILSGIFKETKRTLKPGAPVLLTFKSTNVRGWHGLACALSSAGLKVRALAVCLSENEDDHAKRGKGSLRKDLVIECYEGRNRSAPRIVTRSKDDEDKALICAGLSLASCGRKPLGEFARDFAQRLRNASRDHT